MAKVLFQRLDAGKFIHSINPIVLEEIFTLVFYAIAFITPAEKIIFWLPSLIIAFLLTLDLFVIIVFDDWLVNLRKEKQIN